MKLIKNEKVIDIMQNTLNFVDPRLVNHGKRVAYLVYKMLEGQKYSDKELRDICILSLLHDIGAYKTEEIDKMAEFETTDVWDHSIYGYLFLKHFSPLKQLAPVIFFHHADCSEIEFLNPAYQHIAQTIFLCDRVDVYLIAGGKPSGLRKYIEGFRNKMLYPEIADMFLKLNIDIDKLDESINTDKSFLHILYDTELTRQEVDDYIKMTIFSIESRSSQTVIHTIAVVCVSAAIAKICGLSEDETENIATAAILHDIGKTGVPVNILESNERLNENEMSIMKSHVDMTEKIISGCVDDVIMKIAVRHHEKLDGTGYPRGLASTEFSLSEKIVIIADIFSALCQARSYKEAWPKEKIIGIFTDMSAKGLIDNDLVRLVINNFNEILNELNKATRPILNAYQIVENEYAQLKDAVKRGDLGELSISEN